MSNERTSSQTPPRNAAEIPTTTAIAVATRPTMTASSRVILTAVRNCESTSWPFCVVPRRWAALGGFSDRFGEGFW